MDIKYFGHSSFFIKGKEARLVTDPFDPEMIGIIYPKVEADIVTISHQHKDHNNIFAIDGNPLIIDWPGQYEKKGMRITGFKSFHDKKNGEERGENTLFKIEEEEISVLHCGDLGLIPDAKFLDDIGEVDILIVPVGGFYTINSDEAIELIKKIEPSIIIPMHYNTGTNKDLAPLSEFLKKMGAESLVPVPKLTIKKEELGEEMKVVSMQITS